MYLSYKCNRCKKIVKAKLTKVTYKNNGGTHNRVDCAECGKFIKYLGKDDFQEHPEQPDYFDKINFKLDLILDNLGIIQYR